jgi:predicted esterase
VWIAHGRRDPVIGIEFARAARDALSAAPVDLTHHEHEGAHHVDPRLLAELPTWVERAVDAAAATAP